VKEVTLSKGYKARVDDDVLERAVTIKWCANVKTGARSVYAQGSIPAEKTATRNRPQRTVSTHRWILGEPEGLQVDHIDGNGLNNQRHNLRVATRQQNMCNQPKYTNNTSGYKGVSFDNSSRLRPWAANIQANGKTKKIGRYATADLAAEAYNKAAIELHGEFTHLNVIKKVDQD